MVAGLENIPTINCDLTLAKDSEYYQALEQKIKTHYAKASVYKGKPIVVRTKYFIGIQCDTYIQCFSWFDICDDIFQKKRKIKAERLKKEKLEKERLEEEQQWQE